MAAAGSRLRNCGPRWLIPPKRYQVDPSRYYFRTNPLFETGAEQYAWMNDIVCVGSGYLVEGGIAYNISQIIR